jgi:RNA-directed DNA polymerase
MIMSSTIKSASSLFERIYCWENLLSAWQKAARGKRSSSNAAHFEYRLADRLLVLQHELANGCYQPGTYTHFVIREPKRRLISAAPFRDRVVHHALGNIIEPAFERRFIPFSYANRVGKGTHRAIDRLKQLSQCYRYGLRLDIRQYFPSIDHEILMTALTKVLDDEAVIELCRKIISSGSGVLDAEYSMVWFDGDDLLATLRPRGLPIGNLTSQFWSNCYLHALDVFVMRQLGCNAYLRYVDDFALFSDSKQQLWAWKSAIIEFLAKLRLTIHEGPAQVVPVTQGIPWLGFVVYPDRRRVKGRKVRQAKRHLHQRFDDWQQGKISFAEFDASIQGWINHVRYADSWRLRENILDAFRW